MAKVPISSARRKGPSKKADLENLSERDRLILSHTPLVVSIAEQFHKRAPIPIELQDLIQIGWCGFLAGMARWDPDKEGGTTLGGYCRAWVRGAIYRKIYKPRPLFEDGAALDEQDEWITKKRSYSWFVREDDAPTDDEQEPTDNAREIAREILQDIIEELPDYKRQIVRALFIEGKKHSQVAREMGVLMSDVVKAAEDSIRWLREVMECE